jgi:hypothetical protein
MENLIEEEREYRLSVFTKVFYCIIAAGICWFGVSLSPESSATGLVFRYILMLLLFVIAGLMVMNVVKRKLVINRNSIIYTNLFYTRTLPLQAIRGYRVAAREIKIESTSEEYTTINLGNHIDFAESSEIRKWITTNFKDLNAEDLAAARRQLMEDSTLGNSPEERERKYRLAEAIAVGYNIFSVLTGFILLFFSSAFGNILMIILPWIGVVLLFSNKGLIKLFSASSRSIHPHIVLGIILPSFFLLMKVQSYNVLEEKHSWLPGFFVAAILILPLYFRGLNAAAGNLAGQLILLLLTVLMYGFGSSRLLNCAFDDKPAELYQATVSRHWSIPGRKTSYYINLSPWATQTKSTRLEIKSKLYHTLAKGDTVIIRLKPGLLQIPWYWVEQREDNIITERTGIHPN